RRHARSGIGIGQGFITQPRDRRANFSRILRAALEVLLSGFLGSSFFFSSGFVGWVAVPCMAGMSIMVVSERLESPPSGEDAPPPSSGPSNKRAANESSSSAPAAGAFGWGLGAVLVVGFAAGAFTSNRTNSSRGPIR